jgi:hypothetical protein
MRAARIWLANLQLLIQPDILGLLFASQGIGTLLTVPTVERIHALPLLLTIHCFAIPIACAY